MKEGCQRITVDVPKEAIVQMLRLNKGNRTTTVNLAIKAYLEVQGPAVNRFAVDCAYFRGELHKLSARLDSCTPTELRQALLTLEATVVAGYPVEFRDLINEAV